MPPGTVRVHSQTFPCMSKKPHGFAAYCPRRGSGRFHFGNSHSRRRCCYPTIGRGRACAAGCSHSDSVGKACSNLGNLPAACSALFRRVRKIRVVPTHLLHGRSLPNCWGGSSYCVPRHHRLVLRRVTSYLQVKALGGALCSASSRPARLLVRLPMVSPAHQSMSIETLAFRSTERLPVTVTVRVAFTSLPAASDTE